MKMRNKWRMLWCVCCTAILFAGCGGGKEQKTQVGNSQGLPGELLLVVDEALWNTSARDSLESVLKGSVPGLPQNEPMFRMMRLFPENFSSRFGMMRNILEVRCDPKLEAVEMGVAYDVKARPQVCVGIKTPDAETLGRFVTENRETIVNLFLEGELRREASMLRKKYSKLVDDASREIFGCTVKVPSDIAKVKKGENFLWASTDRVEKDMNYVCYTIPLTGSRELFGGRWVALRDSAMKRNIPGSTPGQWMATVVEGNDTLVETRMVRLEDGRTLCEMRGLWEMHKGGIGGPFVSLAYPDSAHGRMWVTEGFVYSPRTEKRDLVRRMEAALRTFEKRF